MLPLGSGDAFRLLQRQDPSVGIEGGEIWPDSLGCLELKDGQVKFLIPNFQEDSRPGYTITKSIEV